MLYIKKISENFGRNKTQIVNLIGFKTHIAFSTVKVGSYFSLKDSISKKFSSCLVYKFTCPGDLNTQYIGETERQLFLRIKEHTTTTNSSVFSHIEACKYCQNCDNISDCFKVVKFCTTHSNLLASEALLIKKYKPKLNYQLGPDKGSRVTLNIFK